MTATAPTQPARYPSTTTPSRARGIRLVTFRVVMLLVALMHFVAFGAWRAALAPWVTFPDETEHGWDRTPELHRLADGAAGAIFVAITVVALVLAVQPLRRSGLMTWLLAALTVTGAFSWLSAVLQGHDGVPSMVAFSVVWVALVAAVFLWLHPEGHLVLRGGTADSSAPSRTLAMVLYAVAGLSLAAALAAVVWRAAGGVFESPHEDDVLSLAYFGLLWAVGGVLSARARRGWPVLAAVVLLGAVYAVAVSVSLAWA